MKIAIGSDHRGFELKKKIREFLEKQNHDVKDCGSFSDDSSDYPDFALLVAESVTSGDSQKGILICGSGIGMCMAANKVPGIRAALVSEKKFATMAAKHNNANVLCLGEGNDAASAFDMIKVWMETPFEGGRHLRRVDGIRNIEEKYLK